MPVRISVITPSYNQAAFLEETLRSVVSQRDQIHEYFVLDGGSTDGSDRIIRNYSHRIDFWASEKDKGQSDAIDRGFRRATGDFLFWLNSDDLLLPGALRQVREALERHPQWDVLTGYHVAIDSQSRITQCHRIPGESLESASRGIMHVCQQTCFFRKALYEKVGGLDLSLHCVMDTDLWYRMLTAGSVWGHVPRYLGAFRKHSDAKGVSESWATRYRNESEALHRRFPEFEAPSFKHRMGRFAYRASQILSGRWPRAKFDTFRWRGKKLEEPFGRWETQPCEPAAVG